MAFTVTDLQELLHLLGKQPQLRAQFRTLLVTDSLQVLPEQVARLSTAVEQLAEAQGRTEQRLERLAEAQGRTEEQVRALAQAQQRTEERLEQLAAAQGRTEERLEQLAEAQRRTEARLEQLAEAQRRTEARLEQLAADVRELTAAVRDLTAAQKQMQDRLGRVVGDLLELRYRQHAAGYFGRWLRRARAVDPVTLEDTLEATLDHEDMLDVLRLDLLVSGRWRGMPETPEVWLAVEVAAVLDEGDVARAWRRASLLRQAGYRAVPMVAGERITADAQASARAQTVGVVLDGQAAFGAGELAGWLT